MLVVIPVILLAIIIIAVLIGSYHKTGPDQAMVITGALLGKNKSVDTNSEVNSRSKIVKGGGAFVIPILQQRNLIDLRTMKIDVDVPNTQTQTMVPVNVNSTAILRVGSPKKMIAVAAEKIMNLSKDDLESQLSEMVRGQIRTIVSEMEPAELVKNKQKFSDSVLENVVSQMEQFGLEVTGFTITKIDDDNNFYKSTYEPDIAAKQRDAANAKARAEREIREVAAREEQAAQEAEQTTKQNISNFNKTTAIVEAKNQQESQSAEAEANRIIAEKNGDVEIMKQEKAAQVATKNVDIAKQNYQAEVVAKQQAESDAQRINADANAYSVKTNAEAKASQVRAEGTAEADIIRASGEAKADAQAKLGDAFEKNGQAMLMKQIIEVLPQLVENAAKPLEAIDSLTVFDGGKGVTDTGLSTLPQILEMVKSTTGMDIADMAQQRAAGMVTLAKDIDAPTSNKKDSKPKPEPKA